MAVAKFFLLFPVSLLCVHGIAIGDDAFEQMVKSARAIAGEMRSSGSLTVVDEFETRMSPGAGATNYAAVINEQWLLSAGATKREIVYSDDRKAGFARPDSDSVISQNGDYGFKLERKKDGKQEDWNISRLTLFDGTGEIPAIHPRMDLKNKLPVVKIPILGGDYLELDSLNVGENCEVLESSEDHFVATVDVNSLLKLDEPLKIEVKIAKDHGLPSEYRQIFRSEGEAYVVETKCKWELDGGAIVRSAFDQKAFEASALRKVVKSDTRNNTFSTEELDIGEFKLTAYGLPEPALPDKAFGWLPFAIVAAIVFAIGAVVFRSYRSRA